VGNEKNRHLVPDSNKTMIDVAKLSNVAHKKTLKEEIFEKFIEKILDMANQNVRDALWKLQDNKKKEHEKTQKQINEVREERNKHESETKDAIKREIYELKMITQNKKKRS
jgi:hypothetical protein